MKIHTIKDFSLKYTLECGQFFLYEKLEDFYYIINGENIFKIKQIDDILFYDGILKEDLIYFFSLDLDLKKLTSDFENDKYLFLSKEKYFGLRLIRSDPWQCIISFILSSASNISKIQNSLKLINKRFGTKVEFDNKIFYTFPKIGEIDDLEDLKKTKVGYRAKSVFEINNKFKNKPHLFENISNLEYKLAKLELMKYYGIGSKIAECICLFSLNHTQAFPIDTWIIQTINKLYLKKDSKTNLKEIENFINSHFKVNKGLKQQYLFHYARLNLK